MNYTQFAAEDPVPDAYDLNGFMQALSHGPAYFHSGDATGYYTSMIHFPDQKTTITWAVNGNYGRLDHVTFQ
ncbi:MAG: hypothetical protein ACNS62_00705 [Candidatus Cyclobacteriaceae bacterium M3_2C_046]